MDYNLFTILSCIYYTKKKFRVSGFYYIRDKIYLKKNFKVSIYVAELNVSIMRTRP